MNRQSLMAVSSVLHFGDKPYLAILSGTYTSQTVDSSVYNRNSKIIKRENLQRDLSNKIRERGIIGGEHTEEFWIIVLTLKKDRPFSSSDKN